MVDGLLDRQHRRDRHAGLLKRPQGGLVAGHRGDPVFQNSDHGFGILHPRLIIDKARVVDEVGPPDGFAHTRPLVRQSHDKHIGLAALVQAAGTHRIVLGARAGRFDVAPAGRVHLDVEFVAVEIGVEV